MTAWLMSFGHWGFIVPSYAIFLLALAWDAGRGWTARNAIEQQIRAHQARKREVE